MINGVRTNARQAIETFSMVILKRMLFMSYMQHIQHLIKMLKSDNQNERLVACKELMDARHPLPKEAIDALNSATNDSNSEVAGAAQQALAFHAQVEKEQIVKNEGEKLAVANTVKYWPLIGLLAGLIPGSIFFLLTREGPGLEVVNVICVGPAGFIGGIIGANINKSDKTAVWIGSILISIIGAFLGYVIAVLNCISCQ